jgi:hypothetical protein
MGGIGFASRSLTDEDDAQDDDDTDLALRPVLLTLGELVEDRVGRGEGGNGGHCE